MKFSKIKIAVFLLAVLVLTWFLYPREVFLGFLYEGESHLKRSESYYKSYLEKSPHSKFVTLRLAKLYVRMGEPQKATELYDRLYHIRKKDWSLASVYLDHLEDMGDLEGLYHLRLETAKNFLEAPFFPRGRILELLNGALDYAIWQQRTDDIFKILEEIVKVAKNPKDYLSLRDDYERGLFMKKQVVSNLLQGLVSDPNDVERRAELGNIYIVTGEMQKAIALLEEGLKIKPGDRGLLETKLTFHVRKNDLPGAIQTARELLQVKKLSPREKADVMQNLASFYTKLGRFSELESLYKSAIVSPEILRNEKLFFIQQLDIFYRDQKRVDRLPVLYRQILDMTSLKFVDRLDYADKLAFLYSEKKEWNKVIALYQEILKWKPLIDEVWIDRMDKLAYAYSKAGLGEKVVEVYQELINSGRLDSDDHVRFISQLAGLYVRLKKMDKAEEYYREALKLEPEKETTWLDVIYFLENQNRLDEEIALLKGYLKKFPADKDRYRLLVELYLYKKKDARQMALYYEYLQSNPQAGFALSVADLFNTEGYFTPAQDWLVSVLPLFPKNRDILAFLFDSYVENNQLEAGLKTFEGLLKKYPNDPYLLSKKAQLYSYMKNPDGSEKVFNELLAMHIKDIKTLTAIGRDIFFVGNSGKALPFLKKAVALNSQDVQANYWNSEASFSQGDVKGALVRSKKVLKLLKKKSLDEESERIRLKSLGRVEWGASLEKEYQKRYKKYPHNLDFQTDWIDLLIDHKEIAKAADFLKGMQKKYPKERKRLRPYEIRIAFGQHHWKTAVALLEEIKRETPYLWSYRRDLGEGYYQMGEWQKAIAEYETVYQASRNDLEVVRPLKDLHAKYDHRLMEQFSLTDFGADSFWENLTSYQGYLRKDLEFNGKFIAGNYKAAGDNFEGLAEYGKFLLTKHTKTPWQFGGGFGFGNSPSRQTPSLFVHGTYEVPSKYSVGFGYDYRVLRADFAEAISDGALEDKAWLKGDYYLGSRLYLFNKYEYQRNYLPGGATAFEHILEPGFSLTLLQKPTISLGYYFTFAQVNEENNFLGLLGLTRKLRAHIASLNFSQRIGDDFLFATTVFAGEDTARSLHFFEGDIFGWNSSVAWNISKNLDFQGFYAFGKESQPQISGKSHHFHIAISGHWN